MLKKLFSSAKPQGEQAAPTGHDEFQIALAALLVEAAKADGAYIDEERAVIDRALERQFSLSTEKASKLREEAESIQSEALDIQRFTREAKKMSENEKVQFLEDLWRIILTDGVKDPYEDALVRRICGLVYIPDRLSGEARARVLTELKSL